MSSNETLTNLLLFYRSHPIEFVEQVIGATPTEQQRELILSMCKPNARVAVKSCTASGKTAVLAWMTLYFLVTEPDMKGIITAPTAQQLHSVLRAEIAKWQSKMIEPFRGFYEIMSDKIFLVGKKDTQFFSFVTGSADRKESFAGAHADKLIVLVDEASALPSEIFNTLLGTLSSGDTCFTLVSNPVRAAGAFYDLFQKTGTKWDLHTFTSFGTPRVDREWIKEVEEYYGLDSDFYQMRVMGEFPRLDDAQFIPADLVDGAIARILMPQEFHNFPRVLGVDIARFGSDSSVVVDRQGPKVHSIYAWKGLDTIEVAEKVLGVFRGADYNSVNVDGIGIGAGTVDQLRRFNLPIKDVIVSQKATDQKTYVNLRSELYGKVKLWLPTADLPQDQELRTDLLGINYGFNNKLQIILESKKDMKRRGISSPDKSDALALTFANEIFQQTRRNRGRIPTTTKQYLWV